MKKIIVERVIHHDMNRIALRFPYDRELIGIAKTISGARWSHQMSFWHLEDRPDAITVIQQAFQGKAVLDFDGTKVATKSGVGSTLAAKGAGIDDKVKSSSGSVHVELSENGKAGIENFRKWMEVNRYPDSTIRTYTGMVATFLKFVSPKEVEECTSGDLDRIVDEYILPNGLSRSFQNQMISAVKKFYGKVYKSVIDVGEISRPRPEHRLPNVLSKAEVRKILDSVANEKHRVMLSLVYGCGLRRSEVLELLPSDIDHDRKLVQIRQAKGFKDRLVPLSDKLIQMVDQYMLHHKPVKYLFEGQTRGSRYSPASLEKIFKAAFQKAGINKKDITLHGLRHSYATHLLEAGTDLRYIQALLGHKSSRTTEIYTHVTIQSIEKIRSPFDDL